jgi:DNA polymerase elongation subunit (family B)
MQFKHKKQSSVPRTEIVALGIKLGKIIQTLIKQIYSENLNLRYEKCLTNLFIFAKKRYVGWLFENDPNVKKLYMTGVVLKRKDNADIVKVIYKKLLKTIIDNEKTTFEDDVETFVAARDLYFQSITAILQNKIDPALFKTSRKLNDQYKDRTRIAHAVLADRHEKRSGEKFNVGDRIEYLHVFDKETSLNKNATQGDKIELYSEYISKQNNPIDFVFYVNNQVRNPCMQIFEVLLDPSEITAIDQVVDAQIDAIMDTRQTQKNVCLKTIIK